MKRILFLIRTLNMGGAERVLTDIANRMAEDGFFVTVQTMMDEGCCRDRLSAQVHYRAGFSSRLPLLRKAVMRLYRHLPAGLLGRVMIGKGYTHLVAFTEGYPTKIIAGCRRYPAKKIAWVHTDLLANGQTVTVFGSEKKNRESYARFDRIVCVSGDAKRGYEARIGLHDAAEVLHNPVNQGEILEKSRLEPGFPMEENGAFRIAAVGRLAVVKGFDLLVEAMSAVRERAKKPVELYVIGGGPEEGSLRRRIDECGLGDMVHMCGMQMNPYSIMRRCDMQVISSRAEGYPLALCEGHILGLPAVATRCAGTTEILAASGGGILVETTADALAEGMIRMIHDGALYAQCRQNALAWAERSDADAVYRRIESVFD